MRTKNPQKLARLIIRLPLPVYQNLLRESQETLIPMAVLVRQAIAARPGVTTTQAVAQHT